MPALARASRAVIADQSAPGLGSRLEDGDRGITPARPEEDGLDPALRQVSLAELSQVHDPAAGSCCVTQWMPPPFS